MLEGVVIRNNIDNAKAITIFRFFPSTAELKTGKGEKMLVCKKMLERSTFFFPFPRMCTQTKTIPFFQVPIAVDWKGVCLQNTSKPHLYHLKIWL